MTDASFIDFVLDALAPLGGLRARRMFGGHGVYKDDAFFAIVWKGRLYFRTDPADRAHYQTRGSVPFEPNAKQTLGTYWEVPAEVIEDPELFLAWAKRAAARPRRPTKLRRSSPNRAR